MADTEYKIKVLLEAQNKLSGELDKIQKQISSFSSGSAKGVNALSGSFDKLQAVLGSAAVIGFVGLGTSVLTTAGQFEKFQSILTNTLGSVGKATNAMNMLRDVSAQTPFELDKITASYIKLANRGFEPNKQQIVQLGDLTASLGKDFDQLVEALLDAQTGQFERLKEFGIQAQSSGDKVDFTFKGVTTTVSKSDQAIQQYILGLGNLKGVQGSMISQSYTYEGKISNLQDAWTNLSATIGTQFLPTAKKSVSALTEMLNKVNENIKVVSDWGQSTNENVVLVATAFDKVKESAGALPSVGNFFQTAMQAIQSSIASTIPGLSFVISGFQQLLGLAKVSTGAGVKAVSNQLMQSGAMGVAPGIYLDRVKQQLANGHLELSKIASKIPLPPAIGLGKGSKSKEQNKDESNEKQIAQEKELIRLINERLNAVNKLNVSEAKKAQMVVSINEDMQKQLKKIRGDDQEDQFNYFEQLANTAQDRLGKVQDSFKGIYEAVKDAMSKSKDEVSRLEDKLKSGLERVKDLQQSLSENSKNKQTGLTDRFVEVSKQLADMQTQTFNFSSMGEKNKHEEKVAALQKELTLISGIVDQSAIDKAVAFDQLSPAEKVLAKATENAALIQLQIDKQVEENKLLQDQRDAELVKQQNFNIARGKIEQNYTKMFKDELQERTAAYSKFISDMQALASVNKSGVGTLVSGAISGARANGGPVVGGSAYLVGEKGPEIFVPGHSGSIVPNNEITNSSSINISLNGLTVRSEYDIESIANALYRKIELNRKFNTA